MDEKSLKNIISKGENQTVEFKSSFNNDSIISLSAFANTDGGLLIIGVDD